MDKLEALELMVAQHQNAFQNVAALLAKHESILSVVSNDAEVSWKMKAVDMAIEGVKKAKIARLVGKSRQTISTYLNKPEIKAAIEAQLKGVK